MANSQLKKWAFSVIVLVLLALSLLFPAIIDDGIKFASILLEKGYSALPVIPLLLYSVLGAFIRKYLWQVPCDSAVIAMDKQVSSSLTLTGFCLTSLSFLIAFFKDEIKRGDPGPQGILLFFTFALGCFIASYM